MTGRRRIVVICFRKNTPIRTWLLCCFLSANRVSRLTSAPHLALLQAFTRHISLSLQMASSGHHSEAIPVIDISTPSEDVARQVLVAASTHGFLYIKNDGVTIPPQDIDDMFKLV